MKQGTGWCKKRKILYNLISDQNGNTETIRLEAPDKRNSMFPFAEDARFAVYNIEVPML